MRCYKIVRRFSRRIAGINICAFGYKILGDFEVSYICCNMKRRAGIVAKTALHIGIDINPLENMSILSARGTIQFSSKILAGFLTFWSVCADNEG